MFNENQSRMRVAEVAKLPCGLLVQTVITRTVSMRVTGLHLDLLLEDCLEKCGNLKTANTFRIAMATHRKFSRAIPSLLADLLNKSSREAAKPRSIADRSSIGVMRGERVAHAQYVDNFFVSGVDASRVQLAFDRMRSILEGWGFDIHEVSEAQPVVQGLGLMIDGAKKRISLPAARIWKLRLAALALSRRQVPPPPKSLRRSWVTSLLQRWRAGKLCPSSMLCISTSGAARLLGRYGLQRGVSSYRPHLCCL